MKHTRKFTAGMRVAASLFDARTIAKIRQDNERLYAALQSKNLVWDSAAGKWGKPTVAKSIFETPDGQPSDVVKIRIQCHRDVIAGLTEIIQEAIDTYGMGIEEISTPQNNRKGTGARVYISATRKAHPEENEDYQNHA